jgi:polysaccharide biosynthesis transport protein
LINAKKPVTASAPDAPEWCEMIEEKKREEKPKQEKLVDEALLIRPSGQPPLTSLDQISYNYYTPTTADEGLNLHEIWRKIRKRKWLVLTLTFIVTLVVTVAAYQTKSMYRAVSKIAVNRDNSIAFKLGDAVLERTDSDRIKTDLLVLQTYPLLEEVVVRLKLDQNPSFLDGGGKPAFESILSLFRKKAHHEKPSEAIGRTSDTVENPAREQSQRSPEESERLAPFVDTLSESLFVEQIPETSAIQITFTHTDPQLAAQIANTVAQVFIDFSFENKTARFNKSATWLDETTRKLLAQMQRSEQDLASYGQANNFYSTDEKTNLVGDKLANLYQQALKAENDRIIKQSLMQEVSEGRVGKLTEAFADQRTSQLQAELGKLQLQLASLSSRYGPDNPKVLEVDRQTNEVKQLIADNIKMLEGKLRADYDRAFREEELIKQSLERAKLEAIQQNQASIKFGILKQNVETTKSLYNDFLNKTSQANIQRAEQNNDLRLIEPARIGRLIGPKRLRAILVGLILSLVGSIGLALLLEYLDNTVKNVQDVSQATQLPTLALIPSSGRRRAEFGAARE